MNINAPDPASLLLAQLPTRPLPAAPGAPVQATTVPPVPGAPVVIPASATAPIVSVDPLAALLQAGVGDTLETPIPTADLARRYAESGTLSQLALKNATQPQPQSQPAALGAADAKLLSGLAQAYRQDATVTPLPQPANVPRELANAQLPNAPGSGSHAPAVIVVDGRSFPLNPTQATAIRDALGSATGLDPRALANIVRTVTEAPELLRGQPASALRELAAAQIAQPANIARQQQTIPLPNPQAPAPASPQAQTPALGANTAAQPLAAPRDLASVPAPPLPNAAAPATTAQSAPPAVARDAAAVVVPNAPPANAAANAAAIVIDGRIIALNAAQVAVVRANLGPMIKFPAGPGTDTENPLITQAATRIDSSNEGERVQIIDGSARLAVESSERHTRPQPQENNNMLSQMHSNEKVEAVRAVVPHHVTPYEPQLITPQQAPAQNPVVLAPAPDHVILAGHAPVQPGVPAIASIVIGVAAGMTRDDVTAEIHQGGYRISFAGSTDSIVLHANAGLAAQLVFADGTSMRLQLNQD